MKRPPDKYRTVKCSLKDIAKDDLNITKLFDACFRTHKLIIHTYQFLRLWILNKYHIKQDIPVITEDTFKMCFKALLKESQGPDILANKNSDSHSSDLKIKKKCGPKPKGNNLKLYNEFLKFYDDEYKQLGYDNKLDGTNLSQILGYMSIDMNTNVENNIKMHFVKYVKRFVNSCFKKQNNELIDKYEKGKKTELRKTLNKELYEIKEDLLNNTLKCNKKYHYWINKHRHNIFPKEFKDSYEFDIDNNPQKYIKGMIYMCLEIEKEGTKAFQFFPLRTDIIMKYCPIDTKSLIELFVEKNKNDYLTDIEHTKHDLWDKYFRLNKKVFRQKDYVFDHRISTDCFSVSIQLIHKDYVVKEQEKKTNMKNKKKEMNEKCKDMNDDEKKKFKDELEQKKKAEQEKFKLENKKKRDLEKDKFKKLPKEEQKKIKDDQKKERLEKQTTQIEYPYLEELTDKQYEDLKKQKWAVIDEGMSHIIHAKDKDGNTFIYRCRQHLNRNKRLKYQQIIKNHKDKLKITIEENKLSDYNSKSCNLDKFKEFVKKKNELNVVLLEKYKDNKFRQYKWYSYIQKKRAEDRLVNDIKEKYDENTVLIIGDWDAKSSNGIKKISVPNKGLKRKLAKHFKIYMIDEFRTSCLHYKTENRCENMYVNDKKGVSRKLHSVLTFKAKNNRLGCINRDENATNNMIKIVKSYLKDKTRPLRYTRGDEIK